MGRTGRDVHIAKGLIHSLLVVNKIKGLKLGQVWHCGIWDGFVL